MFSKPTNKPPEVQPARSEPPKMAAPSPSPTPQRQPPAAPAPKPSDVSLIGTDLRIVGDLHSSGNIRIDGNIEGDVNSIQAIVGEGAHVQGSINAESVLVAGAVSGQVNADEVTIAKTAKVLGNVIHHTLSIEAGAFLEGRCQRKADGAAAREATKVSALKPAPADALGRPKTA